MKYILMILTGLLLVSCSHPEFTVYPQKNRGNERPLVYDSSEILTVFKSGSDSLEMNVALHSREFPNGILWTISVKAPLETILPQEIKAKQNGISYSLFRLESDQQYPNYGFYIMPPKLLKNCRFSEELKLVVEIDDQEWVKISNGAYVENFGMFYSFVTIDIERNTSILFIH